jgi:hypothetical protein
MTLSIRSAKLPDGREVLCAFRKYERTHSTARAYHSPRGFWILHLPNKPIDACLTRVEAVDILKNADREG